MPKQDKLTFKKAWPLLLVLLLILGVGLFFTFDGINKIKETYWNFKVKIAFKDENEKLGEPLKALGFTNIESEGPKCDYAPKYGYLGKPLGCKITQKSFMIVGNKDQLNQQAKALKAKLQQNGWTLRDDMEMTDWFKKITDGVDYQPDHYNYKYDQATQVFCDMDFVTAFSKPKPPAINVVFTCRGPEAQDPMQLFGM